MKQCPNPNCMLYTRLDELPDAYVKCPGCGGLLVEAGTQAHAAASGSVLRRSSRAAPLVSYEDDTLPSTVLPDLYDEQAIPLAYGDEYDEEQDEQFDFGYAASAPRTGNYGRGRVAFILGALVFVVACAGLLLLVGGRFFPQSRVFSGPVATETALALLRPPVNTPISILPTLPALGLSTQPTPPPQPPPVESTAPPPEQPAVVPTTAAEPPPLAPPPASILDAQLAIRLEGGEPVGSVSAYGTTDTFNLAVRANYGSGAVASLLARWYGPGNAPLYELRKDTTQAGSYYVGFTVRNDSPWPPGDYRVDIHANDSVQPAHSIAFTVVP